MQDEGGLDGADSVEGSDLVAEIGVEVTGAGMHGGGDDVGLTGGGRREAHLGV